MTEYYHSYAYYPDCERDPDHSYRRQRGGCGGWRSYDGPCGADDCPDCFSQDENCEDYDEMDADEVVDG